jgi:uncharacterized protein (TIGR03118 family)
LTPISAWAGGLTPFDAAVLAVDNSSVPNAANGAVYKGLAFGTNVNGVFFFATNFRAGTIDVFAPAPTGSTTGHYVPATTDGGFKDPSIPPGYAPFGIQNINGDLFVTYAKQNAQKHDGVAGPGHGFVDVFDTDGHLLRRFAARGELNSPGESCGCPSPLAASAATSSSATLATAKSMFTTPRVISWMSSMTRMISRWSSTGCGR